MGFGLVIGFIGLFGTACDYALQFTIHIHTHQHAVMVLNMEQWKLRI
jgi:hypothetical protein